MHGAHNSAMLLPRGAPGTSNASMHARFAALAEGQCSGVCAAIRSTICHGTRLLAQIVTRRAQPCATMMRSASLGRGAPPT